MLITREPCSRRGGKSGVGVALLVKSLAYFLYYFVVMSRHVAFNENGSVATHFCKPEQIFNNVNDSEMSQRLIIASQNGA